MKEAILIFLAVLTIGSALFVALSRNMVYSAFSLLVTFTGVAGLYAILGADFIAGVQLLVYVGGVLVIIIFAVMLTQNISERKRNNLSRLPLVALILSVSLLGVWLYALWNIPWATIETVYTPNTEMIGNELLTNYLLPFEMISVLLLVGLVGAVSLVRLSHKPNQSLSSKQTQEDL